MIREIVSLLLVVDIGSSLYKMERHKPNEVNDENKWQHFVRRQSSKIITFADDIVLPKNERIARQTSRQNPVAEHPGLPKTDTFDHVLVDMRNSEGMYRRASRQNSVTEYAGVRTERMSPQISGTDTTEVQSVESHCQHKQDCTVDEVAYRKVEHFPIFMIGISIIQTIVFYSCDENKLTMLFAYDPHRRHEIWRLLTPILVHSGYAHLMGNLMMQLILGVLLEIVHEWNRISVIYLASVFGGSLCVNLFSNKHYAVGASAGVMGLLFSHISTIILNWNEMDRKFSRFFCVFVYIAYSVGIVIYREFIVDKSTQLSISQASHIGGAVTGFMVSILVLKNFKEHPWEMIMQKIFAILLIAALIIVFVINISIPKYFPAIEWNFDYKKNYYTPCDTDEMAC